MPSKDCPKSKDSCRAAAREFAKDAEQFDDLTMLCLEYHPDSLE